MRIISYKAKARHCYLAQLDTYFVFFEALCAKALPAAVFEALPVRTSRRTLEAAEAAFAEVCLLFLAILSPPCSKVVSHKNATTKYRRSQEANNNI